MWKSAETKKWLAQIAAMEEEHPLRMKRHALMSPLDIIEEMNRQFDDAIITTDVGQHMMLVSQYAEITEKKQLVMSGGLGTMGYGFPAAIGAQIGNPEKRVIAVSRGWRYADEYSGVCNGSSGGDTGHRLCI